MNRQRLTCLELCAGAGGQAIGLEQAGFEPVALIDIDSHCCNTLRANRPEWNVLQGDLKKFDASPYTAVDLVAGGLPCPPFSKAGKQLGNEDERDMFPHALRIIEETKPKAIMIENVRGFLDAIFEDYRHQLRDKLRKLGYEAEWRILNASDFGVPQLRPRVVIVAMRKKYWPAFVWPTANPGSTPTVGDTLFDLISQNYWRGAREWRKRADEIAPTIVGGSKKHGGPDLGPTRAKRAWASLGVDGHGVADEPPADDFVGMPKLTVRMVARLQGFPDSWVFTGKKTPAYRQVGNAFPPPVAHAVAMQIRKALETWVVKQVHTA